jgi:hypothetical protein
MREPAASFIHAGDVYVARGQVAGDLDVPDEWSTARDLSGVRPGNTVVS